MTGQHDHRIMGSIVTIMGSRSGSVPIMTARRDLRKQYGDTGLPMLTTEPADTPPQHGGLRKRSRHNHAARNLPIMTTHPTVITHRHARRNP